MRRIGSLATVRLFGGSSNTNNTRTIRRSCLHLHQPSRGSVPSRRFLSSKNTTKTPQSSKQGGERNASSDEVGATAIEIQPDDNYLGLGTHMARLASAFGLVYVFSEYGIELTICEGPSMCPTIKPQGEIVLLDRATPRLWGMQGGYSSNERKRQARKKQADHELQLLKSSSGSSSPSLNSDEKINRSSSTATWHEPRIPVNHLPSTGAWERFWTRLTTGISVGDVVVVQHPDRIGTVCKRVCGLPGDIVTKPPPMQTKQQQQRLLRRRSALLVLEDGMLWLEGDNPSNSSDSRNYGPVPASMIVGRVLFRVWPIRGNAMMERGSRPDVDESQQRTFSGTLVLPAGYDDQIIVRRLENQETK